MPEIYDPDYAEGGLLAGVRNGRWLEEQRFPPLRYHVPGLVPEGVTVLAGAPKVGKSWLLLHWVLTIAAGGGDVLYLALEDGDRRMLARCRRLLANEWRPDDPIPERFEYVLAVRPGQLLATITVWLEKHAGGLCAVDTLGRCLPPAQTGETPYGRDYRVMSALKDTAAEFPGAGLLLSHHDRKATTFDFVEKVSGTNGIAGGADTVLVLTRPREDSEGLLQVSGRDVTEAAYAMRFDAGIWELDGGNLDQAAATARARRAAQGLEDRSADIVAYVTSTGKPARPADVAAAVGIDGDTAGRYLRRLAAGGRLSRTGRGLYTPVRSVRMSESDDGPNGQTDTSDTPLWPQQEDE